MGKPSRVANAGTFFVTTQTAGRRRIFQVERNALLLLEKLQAYRTHYFLHAYVLMPDHIHLLLTPGDVTLERCLQLIKGGFSHALGSSFTVWQRGFTDHRLRDAQDAAQHIRYIEQNPVRAHFVLQAEAYAYSSVSAGCIALDPLPEHLAVPQGLKPHAIRHRDGTAEAVPLRMEPSLAGTEAMYLSSVSAKDGLEAEPRRSKLFQDLVQGFAEARAYMEAERELTAQQQNWTPRKKDLA